MNYAIVANGIIFPFTKYEAAEQALQMLRGASLHRILGKQGVKFVLGGAL